MSAEKDIKKYYFIISHLQHKMVENCCVDDIINHIFERVKCIRMKKMVIIVNGHGGVGKDTLCDFAADVYKTRNISSVAPIKEMAAAYGWKGEKDAKSRKFLADLKQAFTAYNDLPTQYLLGEYQKFLDNRMEEILFVHIRESLEIEKFKKQVDIPCVTLLVRRKAAEQTVWGNAADDDVMQYQYDYYYHNDCPLEGAKDDFLIFLNNIIRENKLIS